MKVYFTLKRMLIGLMTICVLLVVGLMYTSFRVNISLVRSQNMLTDIMLPLEGANRDIEAAVRAFIVRQGQIARVTAQDDLNRLGNRQATEEAFEQSLNKLEALSAKIAGSAQEIQHLRTLYTEFLEKDMAFLRSSRQSLALKETIDEQLGTLARVSQTLQIDSEAISGRVNLAVLRQNFAIRRKLNTRGLTQEVYGDVEDLLRGKLPIIQTACNNLRIAVQALSTYGRQVVAARTVNSLSDLEANSIAQTSGLIEHSLATLKREFADSEETEIIQFAETIQRLEYNAALLESAITEADTGLLSLQTQWLLEQERRLPLNRELQSSVDAIAASLNKIRFLSTKLKNAAEKQSLQTTKMAGWFTASIGFSAIGFMVIVGLVIIRRITTPLNTAVSFAYAVAQGDLTTDIKIHRQDEIGALAAALRMMKESIRHVLKETDALIQAVRDGKLDTRGNAGAFSGGWRDLVAEINKLIEAFTTPLNVTAEYIDRIAKGDIPEKLTDDYRGGFNEIKNNLNQCIDAVSGVVAEMTKLTDAAVAGRLNVRGNPAHFQGDFARIVSGVNATLDAVVDPLTAAAAYVHRIARGEIPEPIATEYAGDFQVIKNNLNALVDGLRGLTQAANAIADGDMSVQVSKRSDADVLASAFQHMAETIRQVIDEINRLVEAAVEGRLDVRGEAYSFRGDYAAIVKGVNQTLDAVIGPLSVAADYVDRISKGDLPPKITDEYKGDFSSIKQNLNMLIHSNHDVILLAQKIAGGNLNVNVALRSEHDELMKALAKMVRYLQDVATVTERISNKDLEVSVTPKSDQDGLNQSLQQMVSTLQTMMAEIEHSMAEVRQQNWLRTGQAELGDKMRGEQDIPTLARQIISYAAAYLGAKVGTIYLADHAGGHLRLVGSYAYTKRKENRSLLKFGEGLVGQAALEKQSILFSRVPHNYLEISSSLGATDPQTIVVTPFLYEGEVKGVIELGTAEKFTTLHQQFLEMVSENIAIAFMTTQTRVKMQELLEATREQAKELQTQQEQLQASNAQLEAQTQSLQASEQKLQQQQEELRQTNEELEQQTKALEQQQRELRENNLKLENARQQVEQKAQELELSSRYKSEFLANMSHELRTPLNSLLILSKLLAENKHQNLTDKQVEYAHTIHAAGADLLELINDVLDLSKIEAGKMSLHIEQLSVKGLCNYVKQHFTHIAEEKGVKLRVRLNKGLPATIQSDRQRVEQILKNLLSNAIKFTDKGGRVTVSIKRPAGEVELSRVSLLPQHVLAIAVTDTGIGIPEEQQRPIFEAFQQADGKTSRKYGGTGLGLPIVRELSKLLGGEVQLQSEPGKGSMFTLYLPEYMTGERVSDEMKLEADTRAGAESVSSATPPPSARKADVNSIWDDRHDTISPDDRFLLIIEDDPGFANILFELAREKGFKGLIAGDGSAGLQLAYQYRPQAIILDVGLPGMDGWTVMKKLKQHADTRHIPVHFISAHDRPLDALKMGAIGYLTKPVNIEKLNEVFTTIETAISKSIKKLLILEDDEATRKAMLDLLHTDNVQIITTSTATEAFQTLQQDEFDCLVIDLGLKDIPGIEFLETIKGDPNLAQLPVIVYTGRELSKEEESQLKKHAESIIIKGVKSPERLLDEVTLFLHRVESELPEDQQKALRKLHDKEMVLADKKILMVDDDMRNVFALSNVLEEKGMHVLIAENGKEALRVLEQESGIELVLMDIMMPQMDGYATMRHIRKNPACRKLPIIALTAKAMKGDRQRCIEAGANDYLSKPVDMDKLLSLLRVWLY